MWLWKTLMLGCVGVGLLTLQGCDSSGVREEQDVERQQMLYVRNQPSPQFDWSLERHLLVELYTARNRAVATYTYVRNQFTGKIMSWCPSIGFPISAATQLSNTMKSYNSQFALPQAEPNGLYSPTSSRGAWVMCLNKDGKVAPRYYEQDIEAYVFPMEEKDGMLVEAAGSTPSIVIDPKRQR